MAKFKKHSFYWNQLIAWFSTALPILLLVIGLFNSTMLPSEKGFYAMSFLLSVFAGIAVQKNIRDSDAE